MNEKEYLLKKFNRNKYSYLLICFNSGFSTLASLAINYYYKDKLGIEPSFLSQILAYMKLPYMIKPFYGLLTDIFPIFGYRRKLYIIFSSITCFISWFLLSAIKLGVYQSALCLFIANVNLAFSSVLSQAIFVELGKLTYEGKNVGDTKDLVSVYFIVKNLGFVLAATLKGFLIELFSVETVFLINSLNQSIMLIAGIILVEERIVDKNDSKKLISEEKKDENKQKAGTVSDLIKYIFQKKVLIPYIYVLIFLSTPAYLETMFYYCANVLKLTANKFGYIQTYQMGINLGIVFFYKYYLSYQQDYYRMLGFQYQLSQHQELKDVYNIVYNNSDPGLVNIQSYYCLNANAAVVYKNQKRLFIDGFENVKLLLEEIRRPVIAQRKHLLCMADYDFNHNDIDAVIDYSFKCKLKDVVKMKFYEITNPVKFEECIRKFSFMSVNLTKVYKEK